MISDCHSVTRLQQLLFVLVDTFGQSWVQLMTLFDAVLAQQHDCLSLLD